jgi:hypothetical protein
MNVLREPDAVTIPGQDGFRGLRWAVSPVTVTAAG